MRKYGIMGRKQSHWPVVDLTNATQWGFTPIPN